MLLVPMTEAPPSTTKGRSLAFIGLLVNVALAGSKLAAGLLGHSYALVADAVESLTDIAGSAVIWGGLLISAKPADRDHPYGHGKAEALAGLVVSGIVFGAGVWIAVESIGEIRTPHHTPAAFTLIVLIAVVIVKETLFRVVLKAARQIESGAVEVDAWHHRSDAITSAAAFVGISIALIGGPGYEPADDWAALLAAGVILFNAWRMVRLPLLELMDTQPLGVPERAKEIASSVPGILYVEKPIARKSGTGYWLDMHVRVAPEMSVREAHTLVHAVKDRVRTLMPQVRDVLIHVEPFDPRFVSPTPPDPVAGQHA